MLVEYHEIPPSDRQGGVRLKFKMPAPWLKMGEDKALVKRDRYGFLRITYFPDQDSVASIDVRCKMGMQDHPPVKADETGTRHINCWPGDILGENITDELLTLRRKGDKGQSCTIAFWGSYETNDMFEGAKEEVAID